MFFIHGLMLTVLGLIAGTIGAVIFAGIAVWLTRGATQNVTRKAVALAYASAVWICVAVLISSGDMDFVHLPNGFSIRIIDRANLLLNLKTQPGQGASGTAAASDTVGDVSRLQIAGRYMLGMGDKFGEESKSQPGTPFLLDSQTGHLTVFPDYDALEAAARKIGVEPRLEPIEDIYARYSRISWFWLLTAFFPPLVAWILGLRRLYHLRKERDLKPA